MLYVLGEIVIWMVAAFILGGLVGWFPGTVGNRGQMRTLAAQAATSEAISELETTRAEADRQRTRVLQLDSEVARLSARHDKERAQLQAALRELTNQLDDERAARPLAGAESRAAAPESRVIELEQFLETSRQQHTLAEGELALSRRETDLAREHTLGTTEELQQQRRATADLQQRLRYADSSRAEIEQRLSDLGQDHRSGQEELAQVMDDQADTRRRLLELDEQHLATQAEFDGLREAHANVQEDLASLAAEKTAQQSELAELRGSTSSLKAQLTQLRNSRVAQLGDLASLRSRQAELVSQLTTARTDLEGTVETRRELEVRLSDANQLRNSMELDIESLRSQITELSGSLRQATDRNDAFAADLERAAERHLVLEQNVDAARHAAAEHEAARRSFAEQLSHTRHLAERDQAGLRADISQRDALMAATESRLAELEDRLATPEPDDLRLISGVGPVLERLLNESGITTFRQLAHLSERDVDDLDHRLDEFSGRVRREGWVEQARLLHRDKYGDDPLRG